MPNMVFINDENEHIDNTNILKHIKKMLPSYDAFKIAKQNNTSTYINEYKDIINRIITLQNKLNHVIYKE